MVNKQMKLFVAQLSLFLSINWLDHNMFTFFEFETSLLYVVTFFFLYFTSTLSSFHLFYLDSMLAS